MTTNYNPQIVTSGLSLAIDAANPKCYANTSSTTCVDIIRKNTVGTLLNGVLYNTANNGTFVLSRANNSYITTTATVSSVGMYQNNFTISSWFNTPNTAPTSSFQGGAVIGIDGTSATAGGQYTNAIRFNTFLVDYYAEGQSVSITPNTWYNMVHTYNYITKVSKVYVNSVLGSTSTRTVDLNANTINSVIKIGNYGFGGDTFTGSIPQVLIYNRELSSDEVLQNFNATRGRYNL